MDANKLKFDAKDYIKGITLTVAVVSLYFGITTKVENTLLEFGFEKRINSELEIYNLQQRQSTTKNI